MEQFRAQRQPYHERGVWLVEAEFPNAFFALIAAQVKPYPMVAFGVEINFDNYDVEPPSVRFVHPLTRARLKKRELAHRLATRVQRVMVAPGQQMEVLSDELAQGFDEEAPPFLCLQGVREYHDHPGHTGDSWWLHRRSGIGTLSYILEQLARYGVDPIRGVQIQLQPRIGDFIVQAPQ